MSESALAFPEQLVEDRRWSSRRILVENGARGVCRTVAVVIPVAAVLQPADPSLHKLLVLALLSPIWIIALRASCSGPAPSALALGAGVVTAVGTLTGLAVVSVLDFWVSGLDLSAAELLVMAAGVFLAAWTLEATLQRRGARRRVVLVGIDDATRDLLDELARHPRLPFDVVGVVDDGTPDGLEGLPRLGVTRELGTILREERPDLVVLASDAPRSEALSHVLDLASLDVRVVDVHHFNEHAFGKVPVHHLSPTWFMALLHLYQRPYSRFVKRALDLVVAGFALILVAPLLLVVAMVIRLSSPGAVFFRQARLGEGGKIFEIVKFRTMIERAEENGVAVWAAQDDARVTPIGRVLRRSRIDELPQLWNVVRGDMSIVGPRPERPEFLELLRETVPFWTRRHLVKPGITGWAQVRHGYTADVMGTADKLSYDLYYVKYRSLLFDLAIASRTVGIVLSGFGAR
jgi:exopolysaccharide biosynthesis polyprenyl glycosylphosphotransferase